MNNQEAIKTLRELRSETNDSWYEEVYDIAISALQAQDLQSTCNNLATDTISRQAAIDALLKEVRLVDGYYVENDEVIDKDDAIEAIRLLPSAQPEIIRCKDCEYGDQDDAGRWFCNDLGCQMGNEDGSGYCANAERRTDELGDK